MISAARQTVAKTDSLRVELVHAWPDRCWRLTLVLPAGARVGDALDAAASALGEAGLAVGELGLAVFGRSAGPATPLQDGDRIELLRPLEASPMQARASRAAAAKRRGG
jgi:uncharacterized protein